MEHAEESHASDQDISPPASPPPGSTDTPSDDMQTEQATQLRAAIQKNDAEAVESLLDLDKDLLDTVFDCNINVADEIETLHVTPLALAAILGQASIMDVLMSREADINAGIGDKQQTSLHLAATYGWEDTVDLLLSKGADINRQDNYGWTALHFASDNGHLKIVSRLLEDTKMDKSLRTIDQRTAFHLACLSDHLEVVKQLWDRGSSTQIHDKDSHSDQPLHLAAINDSYKVVIWLLKKGAEINHQGEWGWTPLQVACSEGSVQVAKVLLDRKANIHVKNNGFNSPVQLACKNVRPGILKLLTARGAWISEIDPNGNTCFHQVAFNQRGFSGEHRGVLKQLVGEGADINKPNLSGLTPLHIACTKKTTNLMEFLLDLGADISKRGPSHGITALIKACCTPNTRAVKMLLDKGADMSIRNNHGLTALALACRQGHLENVNALISKGAVVDARDKGGHTPLCTAAVSHHLKIAIRLLKTTAYYPENPMKTTAFTENTADVPDVEEELLKGFETDQYNSLDKLHTVMYWAVANGSLELAQKCIEFREQVLNWRRQSATWLHIAAQHGQAKLIPILSRAGVLEMAMGKLTAMHLAAKVKTGFFDTTKNLLEIIGNGPRNPAARVAAIVKRDAWDESPLAISIKRKKNELANLFWSEIQNLGTTDKKFLERNLHEASDILEVVAQFEKPGNEDTLRHLLRAWYPRPPAEDVEGLTTLDWAVNSSQAAVVWWLLSNGGYSSGHAVEKAKKHASTTDGVGSLILDLLQNPPPVLDNVANPNDDRPPKLPRPAEEPSGLSGSRVRIVDIFSDGRVTSIASPYPTIQEVVYGSGPGALMNDHTNLHHQHLNTLKAKLRRLGRIAENPDGQPQGNHFGAETPTHHIPEDPQVRWVHLPSTKMHWMRDLVCRLSNDSNRSEMHHQIVMRHFNRSWTELAAGAGKHYMKPQCTVDLISRSKNQLNEGDRSQRHTLCAALYMPYLTMGTYTPNHGNGSTEHDVPSPGDGPRGLEESIQSRNSRDITHSPMTLDQYYYPILTNTDVRDNDQVLSKFLDNKREQVSQARGENQNRSTNTTENGPGASGQALQKQILIVDQLWMWIVDEKTIITATAEKETTEQETTENETPDQYSCSLLQTVLKNMIHGESRSRFERPTSVRSMMELILGCATGFFMKKFVPVEGQNRKDPMEIFLESIRDVANEETRLFEAFRTALKDEESQRDKLKNRSGSTPSVKQMPKNPYHIISPETDLLDKIRDIRDELRMLRSIAEDQEIVWKQAFDSDVWKEVFDLGELKDGLQYYHPCTPTDVKRDLDDMVVEAEVTNDSINTLLDLRQKQASIKEAEFGRIQANDSARQSNSVFIFTVITIVFLPLSFLSSLFALDVSSFPHESGDLKYQGWWLFPIIFGVTAIVSIPAIILAWNVNAISDWIQPQKRGTPSDQQPSPEAVQNGGSGTVGRMTPSAGGLNRRGQQPDPLLPRHRDRTEPNR